MVHGMVAVARCLLREHHKVRIQKQKYHLYFTRKLTDYRSWLHSMTGKMKGKPILDMVGSVVEDYEYLWDNYYFSTATL